MGINSDSRFISAFVYSSEKNAERRTILTADRAEKTEFTRTSTYRVTDGDTLENIAFKFYQDATKWWVIADANILTNPLFLEKGTLLNIPL